MKIWDYICIDPLGDAHTLQQEQRVGGQWHHRSYQDKYYPIHMLGNSCMLEDPPFRALAVIAAER